MFKFAIPAIAALGLTAVAVQSWATDPAPAETGMGWHLSHEGEWAKLAYGAENSDQLALMLMCAPGDGQAVVYGDVTVPGARMIQTSAPIDPMSGDLMEDVRLGLHGEAIQGLAERGRLPVETETGRSILRADAAERRLVSDFVSYCSQSRA